MPLFDLQHVLHGRGARKAVFLILAGALLALLAWRGYSADVGSTIAVSMSAACCEAALAPCSDALLHGHRFRLRMGQVVLRQGGAPPDARVCLRRSGRVEPETCATVAEVQAGAAHAHPFPISAGALASGPGVDFWIDDGGVLLAWENGVVVEGGALTVAALCSGVTLPGRPPAGASLTVLLVNP